MRRSGRTTRQIDNAVQTLFTTGSVKWMDHHTSIPDSPINIEGFYKLVNRLKYEHDLVESNLIIDKGNFTIALIRAITTPVSSTYLLDNGMIVTFDSDGNQIPELQGEYSEALYEKLQERSDESTEWNGFKK